MSRTCQLGKTFRPCHGVPYGACQYCGRSFCAEHGMRSSDSEEICARPICQEKHADVAVHIAYREAAQARSARGFCAQEGCAEPRWGQCSKCQALFCEQHLHERGAMVQRGLRAVARPESLCDHCLARRKLWSRA